MMMSLSQLRDRFGAGFCVAKLPPPGNGLRLRISAAIYPFERLRGLPATIQVHVTVCRLRHDLNNGRTGGQERGHRREELPGTCLRAPNKVGV
jgi:hypothetical protein